MITPHFKQKTTTYLKIEVAIKCIGIGHSDSREVYIFYMEEDVDDQENIRRIMENSCI